MNEHGVIPTAAIRLLATLAALLLFGCARTPAAITFHASDNPEKLSAWGVFDVSDDRVAARPGVITYELNTPLFSDHAQKWRTLWMPRGSPATYHPDRWFDFPVGTIVTKTFYYPVPAGTADPQASDTVLMSTAATYQSGVAGLKRASIRLIETRLLIRRTGGWVALPYVWDADGRDATLSRTGADVPLEIRGGGAPTRFTYAVPNQNQCAGCHAQDHRTRAVQPIGLRARHLSQSFPGPGGEIDQLRRLVAAGYLTGVPARVPRNADWRDRRQPVAARARAYLDINCSHCHSATGPARTSGLWLDAGTREPRLLGACKPPVAAGRGTGNRAYGIVPGHPEASILSYRMASVDPGEMMPELGRALAHSEGVALVDAFIRTLDGVCER